MFTFLVVAFYLSVASSQGRHDYSCSTYQEGQAVDGPCGQRCICVNERLRYCCRQRKDFPSMTREERIRYVNTVIKASTHRRYRRQYNRIIAMHARLFDSGIHSKQQFLPWHRWFLLRYENFLRKVDCRVTLPYWDWSLFAKGVWRTGIDDIWSNKPWGLGGNGRKKKSHRAGCVKTGRFSQRKWRLTPSAKRGCLKRKFSAPAPDIIALHLTKAHRPREFTEFELNVRANLHDAFHCEIGGTMCAHNSANAPEFFLHHAFIDKIWADWQAKSNDHMETYFTTVPRYVRMEGNDFHPSDYIDTFNLPHPNVDRTDDYICVMYQDAAHPLYKEITQRLEKLSTREVRTIPRLYFKPATTRQLRRLGVKRKERRHARKLLNKELEPRKRIRKSQLRKEYDKLLGFKLDDIPFRYTSRDFPTRNTSLTYDRWLARSLNAAEMSPEGLEFFRRANISNAMV